MSLRDAIDLPPLWLALFMALAWFMAEIWAPLGEALVWPGRALIGIGIALALWALWTLRQGRTTAIPHRPPEALVTGGPYAWSRNPIYVADLVILAGWCLALGTAAGLATLAGLYAVLDHRFVRPEEARLKAAFPEAFEAYAARVRRWL